jgi:flavodoxin
MKTLVVYDSLYGHTEKIAQAVAQAVGEESSGEVALQQVGDASASELEDHDLLIVGAPTHGANPSEDMQAFLDQIPPGALEGVNVAGFDTRMTNRLIRLFGFAAPKIAKALQSKGGTLVGSPGGFWVTGGKGPLREGEIERAAAWAKGLTADQA